MRTILGPRELIKTEYRSRTNNAFLQEIGDDIIEKNNRELNGMRHVWRDGRISVNI